jgi:hypothetical protein
MALSPPEHFRLHLAAAKRRRFVPPFEHAWRGAWQRVDWKGYDRQLRRDWQEALLVTEPEWRACYEDRPTRSTEALAVLANFAPDQPDTLRGVEPVRELPSGASQRAAVS